MVTDCAGVLRPVSTDFLLLRLPFRRLHVSRYLFQSSTGTALDIVGTCKVTFPFSRRRLVPFFCSMNNRRRSFYIQLSFVVFRKLCHLTGKLCSLLNCGILMRLVLDL